VVVGSERDENVKTAAGPPLMNWLVADGTFTVLTPFVSVAQGVFGLLATSGSSSVELPSVTRARLARHPSDPVVCAAAELAYASAVTATAMKTAKRRTLVKPIPDLLSGGVSCATERCSPRTTADGLQITASINKSAHYTKECTGFRT
jgi:hypothetical protein